MQYIKEKYKMLVDKHQVKQSPGRQRHKLENGITMDLIYIWWNVWNGFNCLKISPVVGFCEHDYELSSSKTQ